MRGEASDLRGPWGGPGGVLGLIWGRLLKGRYSLGVGPTGASGLPFKRGGACLWAGPSAEGVGPLQWAGALRERPCGRGSGNGRGLGGWSSLKGRGFYLKGLGAL